MREDVEINGGLGLKEEEDDVGFFGEGHFCTNSKSLTFRGIYL